MTALLLAAALGVGSPLDGDYRAALDLLYDGASATAIARLDALSAGAPEDPVGGYLGALALLRRIEEQPENPELDGELGRRAGATLARAGARLAQDPRDLRALFARAGVRGVLSRLAFLRGERRQSAREGARMRDDLLLLRELAPDNKDVLFGLGLYDYYVDVLPRMMKLLRFIIGLPGGDRERGLAELGEVKHGSLFHDVEVRDQLYQIYSEYERKPDHALEEVRELRRRYPGAPLWALKLAEHLRDRMGLYAESALVAREILAACDEGHPNYAPVVAGMARVALGEALLLDLRLEDARGVLAGVGDGAPEAPWVPGRARLLLGRALELLGERAAADVQYRAAAGSPDRATRRRAREALEAPLEGAEREATLLVGEARRLREDGRPTDAYQAYRAALRLWPPLDEAALRVAEDDLLHGRTAAARTALERLASRDEPRPPWVKPWSRLLLARVHDVAGERAVAVLEYKMVWEEPCGQAHLRGLAAAGLERPWSPESGRLEPPLRPEDSR